MSLIGWCGLSHPGEACGSCDGSGLYNGNACGSCCGSGRSTLKCYVKTQIVTKEPKQPFKPRASWLAEYRAAALAGTMDRTEPGSREHCSNHGVWSSSSGTPMPRCGKCAGCVVATARSNSSSCGCEDCRHQNAQFYPPNIGVDPSEVEDDLSSEEVRKYKGKGNGQRDQTSKE